MEYIANPVRVTALQIVEVMSDNYGNGLMLRLEDNSTKAATPAMISRYVPVPGDYLVTQEDGYTYINPREVFERKYHPAGSKVSFAADREIASFLNAIGDKITARGEKVEQAVVIYGTYGSNFYVESTESGIEALGLMEVGKATMLGAVVKSTFNPEAV